MPTYISKLTIPNSQGTNQTYDIKDTIPQAQCETAGNIAAKTASCTNFSLGPEPSYIMINMTQRNTYQGPLTMSINGNGNGPIYINGAISSATNYTIMGGSYIVLYADNKYYFRTDGAIPLYNNYSGSSIYYNQDGATGIDGISKIASYDKDRIAIVDGWGNIIRGGMSFGADTSTILAHNGTWLTIPQVLGYTPAPVGAMVFKGSIGTGGTSQTVPSSPNAGDTYKIIAGGDSLSFPTAGGATFTPEVGDTVIFKDNTDKWVLIPSGDEPSGTVTNIATGTGLTGGPITTSGTISHADIETTTQVSTAALKKITTDGLGHIVTTANAQASDLPHHHTYDKATLNGNASSGTNYLSAVTAPNSNTAASASHTHSYKKATLDGDASSGIDYVSSLTIPSSNNAASASHSHTLTPNVSLTSGTATSTGAITYVESVTKVTNGAASSGHTHGFTAPTVSLTGSTSTSTGAVTYVESVTKDSKSAASTGHTHGFTNPTITLTGSTSTSTGAVTYVESVTKDTKSAASTDHTHGFTNPTITLGSGTTSGNGRVAYINSINGGTVAGTNHTHSVSSTPTWTFAAISGQTDCYELQLPTTISGTASATSTTGVTISAGTTYYMSGTASSGAVTSASGSVSFGAVGTVTTKYLTGSASGGAVTSASGSVSFDGVGTVTTKYLTGSASGGSVNAASGSVDSIGTVTTKYLTASGESTTTGTASASIKAVTGGTTKKLAIGEETTASGTTGTASAGMKALVASNFTSKKLAIEYTGTNTSAVVDD